LEEVIVENLLKDLYVEELRDIYDAEAVSPRPFQVCEGEFAELRSGSRIIWNNAGTCCGDWNIVFADLGERQKPRNARACRA